MLWEITNSTIVNPDKVSAQNDIIIEDDIISGLGKSSGDSLRINLNGMYVYPGFFNAHDHLLASYLPRVGNNAPYLSWLAWDNDMKSSAVFAERQQLDPEDLYLLGAYKNLIAGTTTVMDHIPHHINDPFADNLPVRLVKNYNLSHSICSYHLGWGNGVIQEYSEAELNNRPYVVHVGEGLDDESASAVANLKEQGGLGESTVLVHGMMISDRDVNLIKSAGASVVWCPSSNMHIFQKTTPVKKLLDAGVNVCLGTDSSLSGSFNILEEARTAAEIYRNENDTELAPSEILKMVTINPARAFRLDSMLGTIGNGKKADLVIMKNRDSDPYRNFINATTDDIMLVVINGIPVYGDMSLEALFEQFDHEYEVNMVGMHEKIFIGRPKKLLNSINKSLGYKKDLGFLPIK